MVRTIIWFHNTALVHHHHTTHSSHMVVMWLVQVSWLVFKQSLLSVLQAVYAQDTGERPLGAALLQQRPSLACVQGVVRAGHSQRPRASAVSVYSFGCILSSCTPSS